MCLVWKKCGISASPVSYIVSKSDKLVYLQETTVQLMWMSVSLLHVSMEEAARIWSTPINVCVQMVSKVGGFPYFFLFWSYLRH